LLYVFLEIGIHIYTQAGLGCIPPFYASSVVGITGMYHHAQLLWVVMESHEFFALAGLKLQFF
jgi:hypothetical protein